jgi:integrase
MHRILKQALAIAVRWRTLAYNPVDSVDPPKVERRKMAALDAQKTARLLAHFQNTRMFAPVLLAVMCGLRPGQITALRWASIDLVRRQLSIVESSGGRAFEGLGPADGPNPRRCPVDGQPLQPNRLTPEFVRLLARSAISPAFASTT